MVFEWVDYMVKRVDNECLPQDLFALVGFWDKTFVRYYMITLNAKSNKLWM